MSEKILKTLMQLFAIIANPLANDSERRGVVEAFLKHQLDREQVNKYLATYDEAFEEARQKLEKRGFERREGAIAVRIRKLCKDINEQGMLDQEQRIFVVIQALEFCKSGAQGVSPIELGFISALADGLNITEEEYGIIEKFVLNEPDNSPDFEDILIVNGVKDSGLKRAKHAFRDQMKGQIWFLFVPSVQLYFARFSGTGELLMSSQLLQEGKVYTFGQGASIKGGNIKPIYYLDVTDQFMKEVFRESRVVYEVNNIEYRFRGGQVGIHHMSFSEESGRMVGIMGASGAGKSTLLSVLNGVNPPYDGEVLINGVNIHTEKEKIKGLIGYVSQDDLLIEELTVFENLYFNARLCFDNLSDAEIVQKVDSTLKSLGLLEIRDMKVGTPLNKKISGGQRKRLNISLELIREPAIMFLDEPTSGLSSRDSENILVLLKELTHKGKLLFIVIHQPSSEIFKMFDRLIMLDTGGYLIYNDKPVESIAYFKRKIEQAAYTESECYACGNVNPEQIFNIVETRVVNESGQPTDTRRISPADWSAFYKASLGDKREKRFERGNGIPEINFKTPGKLGQILIFIKRDVLSKISDLQYILITLLEAPVLAVALSFLIRYFDESAPDAHYTLFKNDNLPVYIFMSVIIAIFMGLTVSAEEIIKDRKILRREAFLNLSWNSYLMSKVAVQLGISAIQAFTFVLIGNSITGIRGMWFEYWLILFTCWAGANIVGLIISDSFKAVVTIYILIPFLVIPQIILSGVMVNFDKLNPTVSNPVSIPFYGEAITARWGYEALAVKQFKDNRHDRLFYDVNKDLNNATFKSGFWVDRMKKELELVRSDIRTGTRTGDFEKRVRLIRNEFIREQNLIPASQKNGAFSNLDPATVSEEIINSASLYLDNLKKYYNNAANSARNRKDAITTKLQAQSEASYYELKNRYANESLEEFVTGGKSDQTQMTVIHKGRIVPYYKPIYMEPFSNFVKAHFYAPVKKVFGRPVDTFVVNVIVLWIITILFYLALYFRVLKKILDSGETIMGRKTKNSE
ncbi:MAG: ATP-binding cassette domain-containing protein [Bacteroidales bacterium]|nr:ATP-binding cassette domain-containing protein [Bacteroidales bacterium]